MSPAGTRRRSPSPGCASGCSGRARGASPAPPRKPPGDEICGRHGAVRPAATGPSRLRLSMPAWALALRSKTVIPFSGCTVQVASCEPHMQSHSAAGCLAVEGAPGRAPRCVSSRRASIVRGPPRRPCSWSASRRCIRPGADTRHHPSSAAPERDRARRGRDPRSTTQGRALTRGSRLATAPADAASRGTSVVMVHAIFYQRVTA